MNRTKRFPASVISLALAVFLLLVFQACSKEQEQKKEKLVIYTYDAFPDALEESLKGALETEDTTIDLIRFEDTGGLMAQVLLEKEKPKADVVIGLDNTYLAKAASEDLFQAYKPAGLKLVHDGLLVDPEYRLVPFDYGSIALNYDSQLLPDPPKNWEELLDPVYKDKIILMNPSTSSPGRNFLLFTIAEFGEDGYLQFWNSLKPNILTVTSGWSEGYGLYTQGEAPIVLSYDTSPAYHLQFEQTDRYKNLIFGGRAYAQVELAGIVKGTAHVKLAKKCIDHIVSREFQDLIPLNQIMYPVHPGAEMPASFIQAAGATEIVNMDERLVAEKLDAWLAAWEELMRRP